MHFGALPHVRPCGAPQRHSSVALLQFGFGLPPFTKVQRIMAIPKPKMPEPKTLGEKLKKWRLEQNLRQEDVAEMLGVTKFSVSNWERNLKSLAQRNSKIVIELISTQKQSNFCID